MKNDEAIKVFEDYLTTGHIPHPYELREASKAAITVLSSYEQMMKEAVEGRVFMSFAPGHNQMVMADVDLPTNTRVKVIIVKEDER